MGDFHGADWDAAAELVLEMEDGPWEFERVWLRISGGIAELIWNRRIIKWIGDRDDWRWDVLSLAWEALQAEECRRLRMFRDRALAKIREGALERIRVGEYFRRWLVRVVSNLSIDFQRSNPSFFRSSRGRTDDEEPGGRAHHYRSIVALTTHMGAGWDPERQRVEAQKMLEYLDQTIPLAELRALELHERGFSDEKIAGELGLRRVELASRIVERGRCRRWYGPALALWSRSEPGHGSVGRKKVYGEIAITLGMEDAETAERVVRAAKQMLRRRFGGDEGGR